MTLAQIAAYQGLSLPTLVRRKRESRALQEAVERGHAAGVATIANALWTAALGGNVTAQIFYMKCRAGWRDNNDPSLVTVNVLGSSEAERHELELARAMTSQERQQYMAIAHQASLRMKGLVEIAATPVEPGEPTGNELPLDDEVIEPVNRSAPLHRPDEDEPIEIHENGKNGYTRLGSKPT
jgi:hypothetical protein